MPVAESVDSIRSNHFAPTTFSPASQKDRDLMFDAASIASAGENQWSSKDARTLSRLALGRRLLWRSRWAL